VLVHPGGALKGSAGDVRQRLEGMVAEGGMDAGDHEAATSFLPFLGGDDPGAAQAPCHARGCGKARHRPTG
jgi:hypothetical protein